jgi:DNA ligase (NAD+)
MPSKKKAPMGEWDFERIDGFDEEHLVKWIKKAAKVYYNGGEPIMTDDMYDYMVERLRNVNAKHPVLQAVGAAVVGKGKKVQLPYWMGSMDKIKNDSVVLQRWKSKFSGDVVVTDKLDGISGLLYVKKGTVGLFTRGDGIEGQDISHMIPIIQRLPTQLAENHPKGMAVRGELILSKSSWDQVKHLGSNPRNVVAGVLNAKNPNMVVARLIEFVAYEWIAPGTMSPEEQYSKLEEVGFKVAHPKVISEGDLSVNTLSDYLMKRRAKSKYEIDGIIVAHNESHKRATSGNPKYAFAFKSIITLDQAEVVVTKVEWNISKDNYIKPLVHFDSVSINGVNISKATGFNAKYIEDNVIGPGARVVIIRSGDVIPHIISVLKPATNGKPSFPEYAWNWNETGVDIMVDMSKAHEDEAVQDEMGIKAVVHFFDKIELKGVSEGMVTKLYKSGFNTIPSILGITKEELLTVDGVKEKMAAKIYDTIQDRIHNMDAITLMIASNQLGRGFGVRKLKPILEAFPAMLTDRYIPSQAELVALQGIEAKSASVLRKGLPAFWRFVDENGLKKCMVSKGKEAVQEMAAPPQVSTRLQKNVKDNTYVFTGFRDVELEAILTEHGAKVVTSVSKKVTCVVAKDPSDDSGKITKARELGIPVMSRDDFMRFLGLGA